MFLMRFDMRDPSGDSTRTGELFAAALEMARWGEEQGAVQLVISEHHGSQDGYLPSPLILASAMAARTHSIAIQLAALIVPLHDPIRLAEDMAVLDLISGGRVSYVTAVGYVEEEFKMLGRPFRGRGARMDSCLEAMRSAWTGEPFEYQGRTLRVTPTPLTPGGPPLIMGGNSKAAARRAARFDMGMLAQGLNPELEATYRAACEELGKPPGMCINPPAGVVTSAFISEDPDRAWAEIGPHMLQDSKAYAAWLKDAASISKSVAGSVEDLRAECGAYRIFTPEEAITYIRTHGILLLQPLCGGLSPEIGWRSLELLKEKVLSKL